MCGMSDGRCPGLSVVRGLFGSGMAGLLVLLCVPLFLSFMAMPRLCLLSLCSTTNVNIPDGPFPQAERLPLHESINCFKMFALEGNNARNNAVPPIPNQIPTPATINPQ